MVLRGLLGWRTLGLWIGRMRMDGFKMDVMRMRMVEICAQRMDARRIGEMRMDATRMRCWNLCVAA